MMYHVKTVSHYTRTSRRSDCFVDGPAKMVFFYFSSISDGRRNLKKCLLLIKRICKIYSVLRRYRYYYKAISHTLSNTTIYTIIKSCMRTTNRHDVFFFSKNRFLYDNSKLCAMRMFKSKYGFIAMNYE